MREPTKGAVREALARVERLSADYLCEHPEGDAARSGGGLCDECVAIYVDDILAARDAEWRRALQTVRDNYATEPRSDYVMGYHHSLDALSHRMEARDAE